MFRTISFLLRIVTISFALISCGDVLSMEGEQTKSVKIPENSHLVNFLMFRQGMAMEPYYMVTTSDNGVFFKISNRNPLFLSDCIRSENIDIPKDSRPNAYGDRVFDCEKASLIRLDGNGLLMKLEKLIEDSGAMLWDGFNKRRVLLNVSDSGTSYTLFMEFSDGTTVRVNGYDARPEGFEKLLGDVQTLFEKHEDYSRYMMKNFFDSECTSMHFWVTGDSARKTSYKLELIAGKFPGWLLEISDPEGRILEKNTVLSDSRRNITVSEVPFRRFLGVMAKHHAERWNGYSKIDGSVGKGYISIHLSFADRREYKVTGHIPPDGFDEFLRSFVMEMKNFYDLEKTEEKK